MRSGWHRKKKPIFVFFDKDLTRIQFSMPTLILITQKLPMKAKNNMVKSNREKFREFSEGK
jgi:hypothetical protein